MIRKPSLFLACFLILGFAPFPFPSSDPNKRDLRKMQGEWLVKSLRCDGYNVSVTARGSPGLTVAVDDIMAIKRYSLSFPPNPYRIVSWILHLDTGGLTLTGPAPQRYILHGRYELDGDTLTLCVCDYPLPQPRKLAGEKVGHVLVVLQRKKP